MSCFAFQALNTMDLGDMETPSIPLATSMQWPKSKKCSPKTESFSLQFPWEEMLFSGMLIGSTALCAFPCSLRTGQSSTLPDFLQRIFKFLATQAINLCLFYEWMISPELAMSPLMPIFSMYLT